MKRLFFKLFSLILVPVLASDPTWALAQHTDSARGHNWIKESRALFDSEALNSPSRENIGINPTGTAHQYRTTAGAWGFWAGTWRFSDYLNPSKTKLALKRMARLEGIISLLAMSAQALYVARHVSWQTGDPWSLAVHPTILSVALAGAIPILLGHFSGVLNADGTIRKDRRGYGAATLKAATTLLAAPFVAVAAASPLLLAMIIAPFAYRVATGLHIVLNPLSSIPDKSDVPAQSSVARVVRAGSFVAHGGTLLWLSGGGLAPIALIMGAVGLSGALFLRFVLPERAFRLFGTPIEKRRLANELQILALWLFLIVPFTLPDVQKAWQDFEKEPQKPLIDDTLKDQRIVVIPLGPNTDSINPGQGGKARDYSNSPDPARKNALDSGPHNTVQPYPAIPLPIPASPPSPTEPKLSVDAPMSAVPAPPEQGEGTKNTLPWTTPIAYSDFNFTKEKKLIDPFVISREEARSYDLMDGSQFFHMQGTIKGIRLHIARSDEGTLSVEFTGSVGLNKSVVQYYDVHFTQSEKPTTIDILFPAGDIHDVSDYGLLAQQDIALVATFIEGKAKQIPIRVKLTSIEFLTDQPAPAQTPAQPATPPAPSPQKGELAPDPRFPRSIRFAA